jgi:hypothetical protein
MLSKVTLFSLGFLSFAPIFVFFAPFLVYESSPLLQLRLSFDTTNIALATATRGLGKGRDKVYCAKISKRPSKKMSNGIKYQGIQKSSEI